ncbi:MAG: PP2C family protein-serine/threonine phosphatase [Candidatus Rifleibacteriota bacterium]
MPSEMLFLLVDEILSSRILLVAKNKHSQIFIKNLLMHEGFESIYTVEDLAEAMKFLKPWLNEDPSPIDLIIFEGGKMLPSDINEIWSAKETFEMLDIPLVVTGDRRDSEELEELIEAGGVDFIQNPVDSISLVPRLKTLLKLRNANRKLTKHQHELQKLTKQLEEKNSKMQSILEDIRFDLQLAGELQRSFLPSPNIKCSSADFAYHYKPCETIGGDLINVVQATNRYFVVYLLDVSGHGVSAALLAFAIHRYLSSEWNRGLIKKANGKLRCPVDVLNILNQDFRMHNEWCKYFTITYGIYDAKSMVFRYCRAGQTPLLLIKRNQPAEFLTQGSPPVGISCHARFKEFKLNLAPGDRLYLYSDGITEARNEKGELFGDELLKEQLENIKETSAQEQLNIFTRFFFGWLNQAPQRDDIALLSMFVKNLKS